MGLRISNWAIIFGCIMIGLMVGTMIYIVQNAAADRDQAFRTLQIQSITAQQQRLAQTRRIDLLNGRIDELSEDVRSQATTIGDQRRQITSLEEQLKRVGEKPITVRR